jgi:hypothetical protein
MPITTKPPRIVPKFTPITPFEIFLLQVKGTYDNIRTERKNISYIPPQMGGPLGQRDVAQESVVLELTDFEVE